MYILSQQSCGGPFTLFFPFAFPSYIKAVFAPCDVTAVPRMPMTRLLSATRTELLMAFLISPVTFLRVSLLAVR